MIELWKDIIGYEGIYQISDFGKVKALYKERVNGRGGIRKYPERILKPSITPGGYYMVTLQKHGKIAWKTIHRLVAQAFIENPENKSEVNHKDCNKLNNNKGNLEWTTRQENAIHAEQNNLFNNTRDLKTGRFLKNEIFI